MTKNYNCFKMNFQLLRGLLWVVLASIGFSEAHAQNGTSGNSKEIYSAKELISFEYKNDATAFRNHLNSRLPALNEFETSALEEVRRGYGRLQKTCTGNTPPKNEAEISLLERNTLAVQLSLQDIQRKQDLLQSLAANLKFQAEQHRLKSCNAFSLGIFKSQACNISEQLLGSADALNQSLNSYFQTQRNRYDLYLNLIATEKKGCLRSGFSQRLLQLDDAYMKEKGASALAEFDDLLQTNLSLLKQAAGTSK